MSAKPFDKTVRKSCAWCVHGKRSNYSDEVFCTKRGVTSADDCCRKYKYDPLMRTPDKQVINKDFNPEDFKL